MALKPVIANNLFKSLKLPADPTENINWIVQVLNQDETPLLYSLVFGEGVVNDATSVVLFNAIQGFDISSFDYSIGLHFIGNFIHLFLTSTLLGVFVSLSLPLFLFQISVYLLQVFWGHMFLFIYETYFLYCRPDFWVPSLLKSYISEGNIYLQYVCKVVPLISLCTIVCLM